MTRRILTVLLTLVLSACADNYAHVFRWDHIPYVGWRAHSPGVQCNLDCFDEDGEIRLACQGCYDLNKHHIAGCVTGFYNVAPEKAAIDAKIHAKWTEDHCRLTEYGCACMAAAWTGEQKKVYPACDPTKGVH